MPPGIAIAAIAIDSALADRLTAHVPRLHTCQLEATLGAGIKPDQAHCTTAELEAFIRAKYVMGSFMKGGDGTLPAIESVSADGRGEQGAGTSKGAGSSREQGAVGSREHGAREVGAGSREEGGGRVVAGGRGGGRREGGVWEAALTGGLCGACRVQARQGDDDPSKPKL